MSSWRLIFALGLAIFLVGLEVEVWVLVTGMFFVAWKAAIELWKLQKPPRWFTNFLTVIFLTILILKYRTVLSQEASSSFLTLLTSLKLLEERSLRDQKFLFLLGFVLISSLFLFSIETPALVGGLCCFFLLWSAQNQKINYTLNFFKSLPLALLLFLFFPRLQNPFGLQGLSPTQGSTGFSDELNPGSISKIQNSKEVAFRVQFSDNKKYRTHDQYWRGQVLSLSDGLRWTKGNPPTMVRTFKKLLRPGYEVTLEPQGKKWIFVWDPTSEIQTIRFPFVFKKGNYFESVSPIYERVTYQGEFADETSPQFAEKSDLQVPEVAESVRQLANSFIAKSTNREALAESILSYFRAQKFVYSKNPGGLSNTLENFLFKSKKGYCEHYAASFATLLRLAHVPVHVVTGYQGGEFNAYGNFWKFTQSDAHAWTEYMNENNQWVRVDPTSVVAPERLELGGALFEDLPEEWIGQNKALDFLKSRDAWWIQAREKALQSLESLNYDMVLFLINFNLEKQKELFSKYIYWIVSLGVLLLLPFLLYSFYQRKSQSYAEWLLWELEKKAEKLNLHRESSETLRHFVMRWSAEKPDQKLSLLALLKIYETEEYSVASPQTSHQKILHLLKELTL